MYLVFLSLPPIITPRVPYRVYPGALGRLFFRTTFEQSKILNIAPSTIVVNRNEY